MCGRVTTKIERSDFARLFGLPLPDEFEASGEVFPTQNLPLLRLDAAGRREVTLARWGLVPAWHAGELRAWRASTINARGEVAHEKPAFRAPFRERRGLVVCASFFEWQDGVRHEVRRRDGRPLVMAALWDRWARGGEHADSCALLTCAASAEIAQVHDRMPCLLLSRDWEAWLNPRTSAVAARPLLRPLQEGILEVTPAAEILAR